jgi:P27 family predicted phage terminase small subunit
MTKQETPRSPVPRSLSKAARRLWLQVTTDFEVTDSAGLALLTQALYAWDRCEAARALVDAEGAVVRDRFNQLVPHPAVRIERDSRAQFVRCMAALNLDVQPARPPGRPPGS